MRRSSSLLDHIPLLLGVLLGLFLWNGCAADAESDAYGTFEGIEVTVSAQAQGRLVQFGLDDGDRLAHGEVVGLIDTTQLAIQRRGLLAQRQSLAAQRRASLAQLPEIDAQADVLRARLETAQEELARTARLVEDQAATARELNQREGEVAQLRHQIDQVLARSGIVHAQVASLDAQVLQISSQVREMEERMDDALILNPQPGTVLTVFARRGESVQIGSPLYTVAGLDTLTLRAYATGRQLPRLRLGTSVDVLVDDGDGGLRTLPGRVVWIADEAQFTPTPIQTRDERAKLVYAFDVRVPNGDGLLKIGMPGEVRFADNESPNTGSPGNDAAP